MLETWLRERMVRLPATSQLRFCLLIVVHYVLILYDYQMAFSPIFSVVHALGLVRLISRCYAVPQESVLYAPQSLSARAQFADPVRIPVRPSLPCSCLHHAVLLLIGLFMCSCRATVRIPSTYIRIPSSSCYRASFLTDNTSGISCHVRRFIRHAVDNNRVIAGHSLNFPSLLEW